MNPPHLYTYEPPFQKSWISPCQQTKKLLLLSEEIIFTLLKPCSNFCMPGNFLCFCSCLLFFAFFKINFFKRFFQEHYQSECQMISNGLDADQTRHVDDGFIRSLLIWIYTVFKTEYIQVQHCSVKPFTT